MGTSCIDRGQTKRDLLEEEVPRGALWPHLPMFLGHNAPLLHGNAKVMHPIHIAMVLRLNLCMFNSQKINIVLYNNFNS